LREAASAERVVDASPICWGELLGGTQQLLAFVATFEQAPRGLYGYRLASATLVHRPPRNRFLDRLTLATMITAAKIVFRNSGGSSIIARPLSRARRQSEEGEGEDRTARAVQFENVLDH
jgi:hypothetical protein